MKRYDKITPEGTRDLLFGECEIRDKVQKTIYNIFKGRGYNKVVTPALEFYDVFTRSFPFFSQEIMYKLTDAKGRLLVVRPDCTFPIARLVATKLKDNSLPIRLCYESEIYRTNQSMRGHSDETLQSGIELIGNSSERADLEVIVTAIEALRAFEELDFRIEIGHIGFFKTLAAKLAVEDDVREDIRELIESKNYAALNDLLDRIGENEITNALKQLPRLFGGQEVFEKAQKLFCDTKAEEYLTFLQSLYNKLSDLGLENKIIVDLGLVNRNDYYTGVVFRGYVAGFGENVLLGGRYDTLIGKFGAELPATGFGINVDAMAKAYAKVLSDYQPRTPDMLIFSDIGCEIKGLEYMREQIRQGYICENCLCDTLEEAVAYAKAHGITQVYRSSSQGISAVLQDEFVNSIN